MTTSSCQEFRRKFPGQQSIKNQQYAENYYYSKKAWDSIVQYYNMVENKLKFWSDC